MSTVHLIIIADTNDYGIGESVNIDVRNVQEKLLEYTSLSDMWLSVRTLKGNNFEKKKIMNTIKQLYVRSDDVVFFYYTGHGHRNESKEDPWPLISIGHNDYGQVKGFDVKWIYKMLRYKHPRLLIMLTDSCQVIVPDYEHEQVSPYRNNNIGNKRLNCIELFKQAKGETLLISCDQGEVSYCAFKDSLHIGGAYTNKVIESIENALYSSNPTWKNIATLSSHVSPPPSGRTKQNPIWRVTDDSLTDLIFSGDPDDIDNWVRSKGTSSSLPSQTQIESQQVSSFGGPSLSSQDRVQSIRERSQQRLQSVRSTPPRSTSTFCSNCGVELRIGARFCGKCGHKN